MSITTADTSSASGGGWARWMAQKSRPMHARVVSLASAIDAPPPYIATAGAATVSKRGRAAGEFCCCTKRKTLFSAPVGPSAPPLCRSLAPPLRAPPPLHEDSSNSPPNQYLLYYLQPSRQLQLCVCCAPPPCTPVCRSPPLPPPSLPLPTSHCAHALAGAFPPSPTATALLAIPASIPCFCATALPHPTHTQWAPSAVLRNAMRWSMMASRRSILESTCM